MIWFIIWNHCSENYSECDSTDNCVIVLRLIIFSDTKFTSFNNLRVLKFWKKKSFRFILVLVLSFKVYTNLKEDVCKEISDLIDNSYKYYKNEIKKCNL